MNSTATFTVVDGFQCFHPDKLAEYETYPEYGHALGEEAADLNFWDISRLRILQHEVMLVARQFTQARMLEIGCGNGTFLNSLLGQIGLEVTGSELHLTALRAGKKKNPGLNLIQLDATDIPFVADYEIIGAFDVLEHIVDDQAVLNGIYRALVPGGFLLLTVPQHPFLWSSLDEMVHHQRRYTRAGLLQLAKAAGFEIKYVSSFVAVLFPLMWASRLLDQLQSKQGKQAQQKTDFEKKIRFGKVLNAVFNLAMRLDEWCLKQRWSLPFGGTLMLVAHKPTSLR